MFKRKKNIFWFLISIFITLLPSVSAAADSSISYAYKASGNLGNGYIVSLVNKKADLVEAANTSNEANLLGVVTSGKSSVLEVDPSSSTVQVAISGTVPILVSTINGPIKTGDQISISPLSGIGMKADGAEPVIGIAQTSFSSNTSNGLAKKITSSGGQARNIKIGYLLAEIKINNSVPTQSLSGIQQFVKDLTGRTVPLFRIIISLVISVIAIVILGMIIYSAVFGSIIAVGRNPLAKASILRTLVGVVLMAIVLAAVTVIVINLILA